LRHPKHDFSVEPTDEENKLLFKEEKKLDDLPMFQRVTNRAENNYVMVDPGCPKDSISN